MSFSTSRAALRTKRSLVCRRRSSAPDCPSSATTQPVPHRSLQRILLESEKKFIFGISMFDMFTILAFTRQMSLSFEHRDERIFS